jgi:hypothetical protein
MSRFVRNLLCTALAGALAAAAADAQLLGGGGLVGAVPLPVGGVVGNLPVVGPAVQKFLATPAARWGLSRRHLRSLRASRRDAPSE